MPDLSDMEWVVSYTSRGSELVHETAAEWDQQIKSLPTFAPLDDIYAELGRLGRPDMVDILKKASIGLDGKELNALVELIRAGVYWQEGQMEYKHR